MRNEDDPEDAAGGESSENDPEETGSEAADAGERDPLWRLMQRAWIQNEIETERPPDEVIVAYLCGLASESERSAVQLAMVRSSEFRREMIELSKDFDRLGTLDAEERFDSVPVPEVPDWDSFRNGVNPELIAIADQERPSTTPSDEHPSRKGDILPRVVGALGEFIRSALSPLPVYRFSPLRGVELEEVSATAEDAALSRLSEHIVEEAGTLRIESEGGTSASSDEPTELIRVRLRSPHETWSMEIEESVPAGSKPWKAWLFLIPSRELYEAAVTDAVMTIECPAAQPSRVCFVLTYAARGGFLATPFRVVRPREAEA